MTKINLFHNPDDIKYYRASELIFSEGTPGEFMCNVLNGEVELSQNGRLITTLSKGDIFGEMSVINDTDHSVTATAKTDCEVVQLNRRRFLFMIEQTPNFAIKVIKILAARLHNETATKNL
jgi:CRP-like cAMP-binding protein